MTVTVVVVASHTVYSVTGRTWQSEPTHVTHAADDPAASPTNHQNVNAHRIQAAAVSSRCPTPRASRSLPPSTSHIVRTCIAVKHAMAGCVAVTNNSAASACRGATGTGCARKRGRPQDVVGAGLRPQAKSLFPMRTDQLLHVPVPFGLKGDADGCTARPQYVFDSGASPYEATSVEPRNPTLEHQPGSAGDGRSGKGRPPGRGAYESGCSRRRHRTSAGSS